MSRPLATVYLLGDSESLVVAESPSEVRALVHEARRAEAARVTDGGLGDGFVELTLALPPDADPELVNVRWRGRPALIRAAHVTAILPPLEP